VYDAFDVGALFHDRQVQQHFAGALAAATELLAFHVAGTQIVGLQEALRDHRGRAEHLVRAESKADVAVVAGGKSFVVNAAADVADFEFQLMCVHIRFKSVLRDG
jgi:hypothetical protein